MTKGKKQSLIAGALTSSAGIFISKALGLLYVVPFTAIAGEANMSFYSVAYTYYDILLSICSAGIPFAVAAMVAKYSNNEDYKTVILVRRLSMALMLLSGFVMAVLFIMVSGPLASSVLGAKKTPEDVAILRNVFMILSLAVVCVPFLSSFRGFYQGLKDLKSYAFSQVLEQLTRVISLLALGAFFVYILDMNNIFAVYMAVLSTSLAAIAAIAYYLIYDRKHYQPIKDLARHQTTRPKEVGELFQELLLFGLPYLITALLGNSMNIVNNNFFINTATSAGSSYEDAKLALGIIQVQCNKLTSIPQVLALGFSTGIVPYVTISLENRNFKELRRNVLDCLDTVLYIGAPLCFCLFALASPIYYVMYGKGNLSLGSEMLAWSSLLALTGTLSPICSSLMMSLRFRRQSILYLIIGFGVKLATFFPLVKYTGFSGAITSSVATSLVIIFLNLNLIKQKYKVQYARVWRRLGVIVIGLIAMNGCFVLLRWAGLTVVNASRLIGVLQLAAYGILGMITYFITTAFFRLPQHLFHMSLPAMVRRMTRKVIR